MCREICRFARGQQNDLVMLITNTIFGNNRY
jgi:hypothetical protein